MPEGEARGTQWHDPRTCDRSECDLCYGERAEGVSVWDVDDGGEE